MPEQMTETVPPAPPRPRKKQRANGAAVFESVHAAEVRANSHLRKAADGRRKRRHRPNGLNGAKVSAANSRWQRRDRLQHLLNQAWSKLTVQQQATAVLMHLVG